MRNNSGEGGAILPLPPINDDSDKRFKGVPVLHRRYWAMCAIHCNAYGSSNDDDDDDDVDDVDDDDGD